MSSITIDFPFNFRQAAADVLDRFAETCEPWSKYTASRARSSLHGEPREPIPQPESINLRLETLDRCKYLFELGTPPAILLACWELNIEGLLVAVDHAFRDFLRIAPSTVMSPVDLAEHMAKETGRLNLQRITDWLYAVCDRTPLKRVNWDPENLPELARSMAFGDSAEYPRDKNHPAYWQLMGHGVSRDIVQARVDQYLAKLDAEIQRIAGDARIEETASHEQNLRNRRQLRSDLESLKPFGELIRSSAHNPGPARLALVKSAVVAAGEAHIDSALTEQSPAAPEGRGASDNQHATENPMRTDDGASIRTQRELTQAQKKIADVIRTNPKLKGIDFACELDRNRIKPPVSWQQKNLSTFEAAWKRGEPYCQRIAVKKSKIAKLMKLTQLTSGKPSLRRENPHK